MRVPTTAPVLSVLREAEDRAAYGAITAQVAAALRASSLGALSPELARRR